MEVKTIINNRKDLFEQQIKELLEKGYKIESSNVTFINKLQNNTIKNFANNLNTALNKESAYEICFYALLIKE